ncbi:MAG: FadR/GntR family transcriptional regulator [Acidimicrobiia bacterium]
MAVTDEAILKIKDMISSGRLRPGDKLPVERELANLLGLSRSSLREAVRALDILGILHVRQGDGTYVSDLKPGTLLEGIGFFLEVGSDSRTLEALQARRILEPALTELASLRMSEVQLASLRMALDRMERAQTVENLIGADVEFHRIVAEGSGNALLAGFLNELGRTTVRARMWRVFLEEGATENAVVEHRAIFQALLGGDPALALASSTVHVANVERWLQQTLERSAVSHDDQATPGSA